jgi:hypothetical protein
VQREPLLLTWVLLQLAHGKTLAIHTIALLLVFRFLLLYLMNALIKGLHHHFVNNSLTRNETLASNRYLLGGYAVNPLSMLERGFCFMTHLLIRTQPQLHLTHTVLKSHMV